MHNCLTWAIAQFLKNRGGRVVLLGPKHFGYVLNGVTYHFKCAAELPAAHGLPYNGVVWCTDPVIGGICEPSNRDFPW